MLNFSQKCMPPKFLMLGLSALFLKVEDWPVSSGGVCPPPVYSDIILNLNQHILAVIASVLLLHYILLVFLIFVSPMATSSVITSFIVLPASADCYLSW